MLIRTIIISILSYFSFNISTIAQTRQDQDNTISKTYTLAQIFELAKSMDNKYLANFPNQQASIQRLKQAKATLLPQIVIQGKTQYNYNNISNTSYSGISNSAGINLSQALYRKDLFIGVKQAKQNIDLADLQLSIAENELAIQCAQIYFNILNAQDNIDLIKVKKHNILQQLQSAKRNFEVGNATITDTHEAQAKYDQAIADEITAKNELVTQQSALYSLIAQNLQLQKLVINDISKININHNIDVNQNLQVRAAFLNNDLAGLAIQKAKAANYPIVDLVSGLTINNSNTNSNFDNQNSGKGASIGINVSIPIFTGLANKALINESQFLQQKSNLEYKNSINQTNLSVEQTKNTLNSLVSQYNALISAKESSLLALKSNKLGYEVGVRINIDVLNAQEQVYIAEKNIKKTQYDILLNIIKLKSLGKVLSEEDLQFNL